MITRPTAHEYQARLGLAYAPSDHQVAVFHWIEFGRGHRAVSAVAGAGKTTAIVACAKLITGTGLAVCFNKSIAEVLQERFARTPMTASTIHAHGNAAIRFALGRGFKPDGKKYRRMVEEAAAKMVSRGTLLGRRLTKAQRLLVEDDGFPVRTCDKLIGFARLDLLGWAGLDRPTWDRWADNLYTEAFETGLMAIAARHNLDQHDEALDALIIEVVRECLIRGSEVVEAIDFTDMLWLPVVKGFRPRKYSWIFVDEAQDTSAVALELLGMSRRRGGRMLFVGDPKQAINAFAGADSAAFDKIVDRTGCDPLPLSVCYRCPTSVLDLARPYCPQIEAREGAPEGKVTKAARGDYVATAQEGDLILCRRNAPLVRMCFELIAEGLAAVIKGKDIASQLAGIVRKAGRRVAWEDFGLGLEAWGDAQRDAARKRIKDEDQLADRLDLIEDQEECVRVIWSSADGVTSVAALCQAISDIFDDEDRGSITLSSVHKAKGLEAPRVAILRPELLSGPENEDDDQEPHVTYVAYTRAQEELILVQEAA